MHAFYVLQNSSRVVVVSIYYDRVSCTFVLFSSKVSSSPISHASHMMVKYVHWSLLHLIKVATLLLITVLFVMLMRMYVCVYVDCLKQLSQILVLIKKKKERPLYSLNTRGYVVVNKRKNNDRHICVYNITSITLNRYKQDQITLCFSA